MLVLKINCLYLAELMHPTFEYFYLEIFDLQSIELTRWLNDGAKLNERSTELHEIFADELEVITADEKLDLISIVCMQLDKKVDFSGGILAIRCGGGRLFNHNHQALGLEKLIELANGYWGKV
ncbi:hypothetical protein GC194_10740 [bacterium]|nr:hypothetical protein [bacterium]